MSALSNQFELATQDGAHRLQLNTIEYLGNGVYSSYIDVHSNGFMCHRVFGFDNDEYFLTKLFTMLDTNDGEAILMDMSEDSFIRFKPVGSDSSMITGYIVEHTEVTHSLEFAFVIDKPRLREFADSFRDMVRNNI